MSKIEKPTLLIMAAGLGSRYGGDKQIDGLGPHGEILMQYSIYDAIRAGFGKIVFVIKPEHQTVIERICEGLTGVEIAYAYQTFSSIPDWYSIPKDRVKPFGTVHAVMSAADVIGEPFAVINADDFYGADAFRVMREHLRSMPEDEASMVAYRLKNTVSPNGAVTRGICAVEGGRLTKVSETYRITVDETGAIRDAERGLLEPNALVSMNMWGFSPSAFGAMAAYFEKFLKAVDEGDCKAEYALPSFVDGMLRERDATVRVLSTDAVWFGVTYQEDRPAVMQTLARMHNEGVYPEKLF